MRQQKYLITCNFQPKWQAQSSCHTCLEMGWVETQDFASLLLPCMEPGGHPWMEEVEGGNPRLQAIPERQS